jgi:hypothetical protein
MVKKCFLAFYGNKRYSGPDLISGERRRETSASIKRPTDIKQLV